jgi:hypothetical protein
MEVEALRLYQMEQMMSQMLKTQEHLLKETADLRACVTALKESQTRVPAPGPNPHPASYANATGKSRPAYLAAPTVAPPTRPVLKSLKPGKAIIHSDPKKSEIPKAECSSLVQRANKVLLKINAKVNGKQIAIRAAQILKSGDVCFFLTNKAHQHWLRDNKHVWSKEIHPHLAATPSTYSVIAHGVPKSFNPIAPLSIGKLNVENNFNKGGLIRVKWLADNLKNEKQAGLIVLTFINKDTASRCKLTGVFLNCGYHRTLKFKSRPPQCFKCLKMGHLASGAEI